MQLPNIKHPKTFEINGARFQVVTYTPVTDNEARMIVLNAVQTHRKGFAAGKLHQIHYNNTHGVL